MQNNVAQLRELKGEKQYETAKNLGITSDYLSMIERGDRTPGFKLAKIAGLDSTIEKFFLTRERTKRLKNLFTRANSRRKRWIDKQKKNILTISASRYK